MTTVCRVSILVLFAVVSLTAQSNPVPFLNQPVVPAAAAPGGAGFTLTVNGAGFVSGSVVNWDGVALPTTFVSSAQLTAAVAAADITTARTASVTVVNPTPGGGTSNVGFFPVADPVSQVQLVAKGTAITGIRGEVVADFNGDGKLDLAIITNTDTTSSVQVLLGNGDGTLQTPVSYAVPPIGQTLVMGDFNGDGNSTWLSTYRCSWVTGMVPFRRPRAYLCQALRTRRAILTATVSWIFWALPTMVSSWHLGMATAPSSQPRRLALATA